MEKNRIYIPDHRLARKVARRLRRRCLPKKLSKRNLSQQLSFITQVSNRIKKAFLSLGLDDVSIRVNEYEELNVVTLTTHRFGKMKPYHIKVYFPFEYDKLGFANKSSSGVSLIIGPSSYKKNLESLIGNIQELLKARMKGLNAEERFKRIVSSKLGEPSLDKKFSIFENNTWDIGGVDSRVQHNKSGNFVNFQVKSSEVKLKKLYYQGEFIHKIVVNAQRSDQEIWNDTWQWIEPLLKREKSA